MIEVMNVEVAGFAPAIKGMRNPMNSWERSDSHECRLVPEGDDCVFCEFNDTVCGCYYVGLNDRDLMRRLYKGGDEHRKYLRMLPIWMTVKAPLFWWKEFDTYKVGTVRNSCSTMHKIHVAQFTYDDFSHEGIDEAGGLYKLNFERYLTTLEDLRDAFNATQEKKYWRALIEMLPEGFMLQATVMFNYEVAENIYRQRKNHKLTEWHTFCDTIMRLPYFAEITGREKEEAEDNV